MMRCVLKGQESAATLSPRGSKERSSVKRATCVHLFGSIGPLRVDVDPGTETVNRQLRMEMSQVTASEASSLEAERANLRLDLLLHCRRTTSNETENCRDSPDACRSPRSLHTLHFDGDDISCDVEADAEGSMRSCVRCEGAWPSRS